MAMPLPDLPAPGPAAHRIDAVPELAPYQVRLHALGYTVVEELIGAAQHAEAELSQYLGSSVDDILAAVDMPVSAVPEEALELFRTAEYPLGFAIETLPPPEAAAVNIPIPPATGVPPGVNLIPEMPPIRDQGKRGTCVAHAALAAYEHLLRTQDAYRDLSEQFLYWSCKQNDGYAQSEGTWLRIAVPLLQRDGCCQETTWAYYPVRTPGNEGQGPPPTGAQIEALGFRVPTITRLAATSVPDLKNELAQRRCVAFSIPVYNSWYQSDWVKLTGNILLPPPKEVRVGGHAMCLVGFVDLPSEPGLGGGRFLLRNSWDARWGIQCEYGVGYGTIPYSYVSRYCLEAYSLS